MNKKKKDVFDVLVVGGGPAGLAAALMLARCLRKVALVDDGRPRNRFSPALHGLPSRDGIPPLELIRLCRRDVLRYGVPILDARVTSLVRRGAALVARLEGGEELRARRIVLATGVSDEVPDLPGARACYGKSLFHCPYCDGYEVRGRTLAALADVRGGESGVGLALSLKSWSDDVVLLTNGRRLAAETKRRLERNGVTLETGRIAEVVHRAGRLRAVRFVAGPPRTLGAIFFAAPPVARSRLPLSVGCLFTAKGCVDTDRSGRAAERVFVVGDASRDVQFVAVALSEGAKAALAINREIQEEELR